jgi:hypothetical protein
VKLALMGKDPMLAYDDAIQGELPWTRIDTLNQD